MKHHSDGRNSPIITKTVFGQTFTDISGQVARTLVNMLFKFKADLDKFLKAYGAAFSWNKMEHKYYGLEARVFWRIVLENNN